MYLGVIEHGFIGDVTARLVVLLLLLQLLLLLLQLLLLAVEGVWWDNQVFNFFGRELAIVLDDVAGVHRAVVGEAARAVGRVDVRLVTFRSEQKK